MVKKTLVFFLVFVCIIYLLIAYFGLIFNESNSLKKGVYIKVDENPKVGDLIVFCPPVKDAFFEAKERGYIKTGFCKGGLGLMLKQILAAKNDKVLINDHGIFVNDKYIQNSKPLSKDGKSRYMSKYYKNDVLNENEIIVFGNNSLGSFDSRYFGSIDKENVISVIKPLWTW